MANPVYLYLNSQSTKPSTCINVLAVSQHVRVERLYGTFSRYLTSLEYESPMHHKGTAHAQYWHFVIIVRIQSESSERPNASECLSTGWKRPDVLSSIRPPVHVTRNIVMLRFNRSLPLSVNAGGSVMLVSISDPNKIQDENSDEPNDACAAVRRDGIYP
ncbi:hypothetical protein CBL_09565 [Carabus blaptoides fortunei]